MSTPVQPISKTAPIKRTPFSQGAWTALVLSKPGRRASRRPLHHQPSSGILPPPPPPDLGSSLFVGRDGAPSLTRSVVNACANFDLFFPFSFLFPSRITLHLDFVTLREKGRAERGPPWRVPLNRPRNLGELGLLRWSRTGWGCVCIFRRNSSVSTTRSQPSLALPCCPRKWLVGAPRSKQLLCRPNHPAAFRSLKPLSSHGRDVLCKPDECDPFLADLSPWDDGRRWMMICSHQF